MFSIDSIQQWRINQGPGQAIPVSYDLVWKLNAHIWIQEHGAIC
jgi:hypothetical protein